VGLAGIAGRVLRHVPPFLLTGLALVIGSMPAWPLARHWKVPPRTLALGIYGCSDTTSCCSSRCGWPRRWKRTWSTTCGRC
jgi:hypothetical protein